MLSKHNLLIRNQIKKKFLFKNIKINVYEFLPVIDSTQTKLKNFIVIEKAEKKYLNAKNIIEANKIVIYVKNFEHQKDANTPELILNEIVNIVFKYAASLPQVSSKEYDQDLDMYYYTVSYITYC